MKPEEPPVNQPTIVVEAPDETSGEAEETDTKPSEDKEHEESYDNSADGFHGKVLPEKRTADDTGENSQEEDETFLTAVQGESGKKKILSTEDEDLGIYEDTDVNEDDVSDTELELEKLRAEKKKKELEEKDKLKAEEKLKQHEVQNTTDFNEKQAELTQNVRSLTESAIQQIQKQIITPRTDISMDSRLSSKSWSDPRFLQGISIRDLYWKTRTQDIPFITSMKAEIQLSRLCAFCLSFILNLF